MVHVECPWCAGVASIQVDDDSGRLECVECSIKVELAADPGPEVAAMAA